MTSRPKNKIVVSVYTCDICGKQLCENNEGLPSFRVSTYVSKEIYEHFCDVHTEVMVEFIKKLKETQ